MYRPPRNNNNNFSISNFLTPFSPIIHKLSREKSDAIICGDFNIDLIKTQERELFAEFLDLFLNNGFFPKISLPTRFSTKNATAIDQIFCKTSDMASDSLSGILVGNTSDHFATFSCVNILKPQRVQCPKYIDIQTNDSASLANFCSSVASANILNKMNKRLDVDPNPDYNTLCHTIQALKTSIYL